MSARKYYKSEEGTTRFGLKRNEKMFERHRKKYFARDDM